MMSIRTLGLACVIGIATLIRAGGAEPLLPEIRPLTELPWSQESATVEEIVQSIFAEPDFTIRMTVLQEYLRRVPLSDLTKVFNLSTALEGQEDQTYLIGMMLAVWAKRDPATAWERTQTLFRLVGIEEGPLTYTRWDRRIDVVDVLAIQHSRFRIRREALVAFPEGVEESALPKRRASQADEALFSSLV